jgi:DNA-binding PadR family transcriptional regulator
VRRNISWHDITKDERATDGHGDDDPMSGAFSELGRFAEPSLYILVSLAEGPKHGYAIMVDVEQMTGEPLGPGTLYGALARLEKRGLIEALEPVDRRRPYRLTAVGAAAVRTQLEGLSGFVKAGLSRIRRQEA